MYHDYETKFSLNFFYSSVVVVVVVRHVLLAMSRWLSWSRNSWYKPIRCQFPAWFSYASSCWSTCFRYCLRRW